MASEADYLKQEKVRELKKLNEQLDKIEALEVEMLAKTQALKEEKSEIIAKIRILMREILGAPSLRDSGYLSCSVQESRDDMNSSVLVCPASSYAPKNKK